MRHTVLSFSHFRYQFQSGCVTPSTSHQLHDSRQNQWLLISIVDGMYGQWIVIYCPITDVKCTQDVSPSSMYLDFHCVRTNGISFHFRHLYFSQDVWSAGQKSYGVLLPQCQVRLAMIIEFGLTSEPLVRFLKFERLWKAMDEPSCLEVSNCLFLWMNDRKRHKYAFV